MKKVFNILLFALCVVMFAACGDDDEKNENRQGETETTTGATPWTETTTETYSEQGNEPTDDTVSNSKKNLIAYFSRAGENYSVGVVEKGNTKIFAEYISEITGGDLWEIVPENAYPQSYDETLTQAANEKNSQARPKIKYSLTSLDDYDVVFIGSPIWRGEPPMIIHTFYETYPQLKDKILIPFGTHEGSGISTCTSVMKQYFPNATILQSKGIQGSKVRNASSKDEIKTWIESLNL